MNTYAVSNECNSRSDFSDFGSSLASIIQAPRCGATICRAHHRLLGTDHSENASAITTIKSPKEKLIVQFGCISENRNCVNE